MEGAMKLRNKMGIWVQVNKNAHFILSQNYAGGANAVYNAIVIV